ncbi:MAG: SprT family zinc-dependent metalloprotease [Patescibacteria group bacterium]
MKIKEKTKKIIIAGRSLEYVLRTNPRARHLRLSVKIDGCLVVTKPRFLSEFFVERFMREKERWIIKKINHFKNFSSSSAMVTNSANRRSDYLKRREEARALVFERLEHFNNFYGFKYNKVAIRNQTTRWGSCSKKGNLNFSYRLLDLPAPARDYVIIHELCHLREFNHSPRFWALVARTCPGYKAARGRLKGGLF